MLKSILELLLYVVAAHYNLWQTFIHLGSAIYALASTIWPPRWAITLVYLAHWAQDFLDQPRPLDQWKDSGRSFKRLSYMLDETCFDTCWLDIFRRLMFLVSFPQQNQPRLLDQLKHSECTFTSILFMLATHLSDVWCSWWKKVFLSPINLFVQPATFIFAPSTASSHSAPCDALQLCKIVIVQNLCSAISNIFSWTV